jgi:hypothetical protein
MEWHTHTPWKTSIASISRRAASRKACVTEPSAPSRRSGPKNPMAKLFPRPDTRAVRAAPTARAGASGLVRSAQRAARLRGAACLGAAAPWHRWRARPLGACATPPAPTRPRRGAAWPLPRCTCRRVSLAAMGARRGGAGRGGAGRGDAWRGDPRFARRVLQHARLRVHQHTARSAVRPQQRVRPARRAFDGVRGPRCASATPTAGRRARGAACL